MASEGAKEFSISGWFGWTSTQITAERLLDSSSFKDMKEDLMKFQEDVNAYNDQGDALLHRLVKKTFSKRKLSLKRDLLTALLTYSDTKVNGTNKYSLTPLHLAAKRCDIVTAETLLVFGAHINAIDAYGNTPLDLVEGPRGFLVHQYPLSTDVASPPDPASPNSHRPLRVQQSFTSDVELLFHSPDVKSEDVQAMIDTLKKYGAERGRVIKEHEESLRGRDKNKLEVGRVGQFQDMIMMAKENVKTTTPIKIHKSTVSDDWTTKIAKYNFEISNSIERRMFTINHQFDKDPDEALAVMYQMRELRMLRDAGSRILFLDGGGMKGLVEIEVLSQLEELTGRKITELFDWIVGTSTGGIIALALVHGNMSLEEVRRFYFKLKDDIFGNSTASINFNTGELQSFLIGIFGETMKMNDVKCRYPRVLVPAVYKKTMHLKLHFFNNCFDNDLSEVLVWKVARYTSAGPIYFSSMDDYVDGGILANNPSASGLTEIQEFYRRKGQKLPISLIVSIGGGKPPRDIDIGNVDAHECLYLGKHLFNFSLLKRLGNLTTLLGVAIGESESISDNVASRCKEQGIDYYRFSPQLDEVVSVGETDLDDLFKMVLTAKQCVRDTSGKKESFAMQFCRLVMRFHQCSIANKKMTFRMKVAPRKT